MQRHGRYLIIAFLFLILISINTKVFWGSSGQIFHGQYNGVVKARVVAVLNTHLNHFIRFVVIVTAVANRRLLQKKILLQWYYPTQTVQVGQYWQLNVRLKEATGLHNDGLFDYQHWLEQRHFIATGYVNNKLAQLNQLLGSVRKSWVERQRDRMIHFINGSLKLPVVASVFRALAVGDRSGLSKSDWQVFQRTGTSHLIAISGLHVGLIFSVIFLLVSYSLKYMPKVQLIVPGKQVSLLGAFLGTWFYVVLSGCSVTAVRALLMLACIVVSNCMFRATALGRRLLIAFIVIVLSHVQALRTSSVWLSCIAVGTLVLCFHGRLSLPRKSMSWLKVQWFVTLGLLPITLYIFHQVSMVSFVVNMIAIPWVGCLVLPIVLLGTTIALVHAGWLSKIILIVAGWCFYPLWLLMRQVAAWPLAAWHYSLISPVIFGWLSVSVLLLLLPKQVPGKYFGFAGFMPLFLFHHQTPRHGELWMHMFDVGQGLSILFETTHHTLLYDAGPKYANGFDAGKRIIYPTLQIKGVSKLDRMIISHGDNDHSGGALFLSQHMMIDQVYTSDPTLVHQLHASLCSAGLDWEWDGIRFVFLSPVKGAPYLDNDSSCVLQISNGRFSVLVPGDISHQIEEMLVKKYAHQLLSRVLVVPHHGSKTASSWHFLQFVHPVLALISLGRYNRYHFPASVVLNRYRRIGAKVIRTDQAGAVSIRISNMGKIAPIKKWLSL